MPICLPTKEAIIEATKILQEGGVVSFATETVYGLGCDTFNTQAVKKVYALKNRPTDNPMIAHILDATWVGRLATGWDDRCEKLAERFWPGPLTIILPKKESVPKEACGGFDTVAIRCPAHTTARLLLASFNNPISAPSANISGHLSPTTANHVEQEFGCNVFILDGGSSEKGIESTVLSMISAPEILRPGSVTIEELTNCIGDVATHNSTSQTNSPGTSSRHYAPKTKVVLRPSDAICNINSDSTIVVFHATAPMGCKNKIQMPNSPDEYAAKIYSVLREADAMDADVIVVELPPTSPEWLAINDRLHRCCTS
jgi:L-threonylcarbamoyladenylate synthase